MAPFDYTTAAAVFAYGNSAGTAVDPVNEATVMAELVTAMSRAVDRYCGQDFSGATYAAQSNRALVDAYGALLAYPTVPALTGLTAADYGGAGIYTPITLTQIETFDADAGASVRVNGSYGALRGRPLTMRLSYTGGWANLAAAPPDFQWAMRALCWWAYQKRSAPGETTAIPELGMLIVPGGWPLHIRELFKPYVRWVPM